MYVNDKNHKANGKSKTPKQRQVKGYANTGAMPYDSDKSSASSEDSDLKMLSEMEVHHVYNSKYPKKHQEFNMKRENNLSNQVFSMGKGR